MGYCRSSSGRDVGDECRDLDRRCPSPRIDVGIRELIPLGGTSFTRGHSYGRRESWMGMRHETMAQSHSHSCWSSLVLCLLAAPSDPPSRCLPRPTMVCSSPVTVGNPSTCAVTVSALRRRQARSILSRRLQRIGTLRRPAARLILQVHVSVLPTLRPPASGSPDVISATYEGDTNYAVSSPTGAATAR